MLVAKGLAAGAGRTSKTSAVYDIDVHFYHELQSARFSLTNPEGFFESHS